MIKKIGIILFFAAVVGAGHALPLQGLPLLSGTAFALLQDDGQPCPPECVTDSMEIVTWYPSPYNEYEELRLYPVQRDDSYCTDDKKGLVYYDDNNTSMDASDDKVRVCMGSSTWTGGGWQTAGHWEYISGTTDIKPSNSGVVKIQNLKIDQTTQDGYILTSDANGNASWKQLSSSRKTEIFTSSGYFFVPSGVNKVKLKIVGGGGGGGMGDNYVGGSGGGGGGAIDSEVLVTPESLIRVEIGKGGTGASCCNNYGTAGTQSSFGSIIAYGGAGGPTSNYREGGAGGTTNYISGHNGMAGSGSGGQGGGSGGAAGITISGFSFGYGGQGGCYHWQCGAAGSAGNDSIAIIEY